MENSIKKVGIFIAGVGVGSLVTWNLVKEIYRQISREEIDSVKETFSKREMELLNHVNQEKKKLEIDKTEFKKTQDIIDYTKIASRYDTASEVKKSGRYPWEYDNNEGEAYVISPEEFGALEGYGEISLYYYSNGYLADENDELIDNVEDIIGHDTLEHMGEHEDDALHVRNDTLKQDYEILRMEKNYMRDNDLKQEE